MIRELSQLTMSQYIDVVCGKLSVLQPTSMELAQKVRTKLISDYAMIADPTGTTAHISNKRNGIGDESTVLLFKICSNLIAIDEFDDVRAILEDYGINAWRMADDQLKAEVKRRLARAKSMLARQQPNEVEVTPEEETIRRSFDRQLASIMAYFKFQIDFNTIKATSFAYLLHQADQEIRAKMAAMNRR